MATVAAGRRSWWLGRYRREMVHALRMTAASLASFALVHSLGLSEGLWAVITAIVVSQSRVGGSLKVAFDQFVGSLLGAGYATLVAVLISPHDVFWSAVSLVIGLGPLAFLAALSPGFRIAPITGAILLLGGAGLGVGPLGFALSRIFEVGLGCAVGILVSILVVPAQAARSVIETTARLAELMADQLSTLAARGASGQADLGVLAVQIRRDLIRLDTLAQEAARERRSWLTDVPDSEPLLRTTRRLRQDVDMLPRAAREAGRDATSEEAAEPWLRALGAGATLLRQIGQRLSGQEIAAELGPLNRAVRDYRTSLDEMRRAGQTRPLSTDTIARLFGIGFSLDQFRRDLNDLLERSEEVLAWRRRRNGPVLRHSPTTPVRQGAR